MLTSFRASARYVPIPTLHVIMAAQNLAIGHMRHATMHLCLASIPSGLKTNIHCDGGIPSL